MTEVKSKVIINNGKYLQIISDKGIFKFNARMKVAYDSVNEIFGARAWVYEVIHLPSKKKVKILKNGMPIFKTYEYQYKIELMQAISESNMFTIALKEIKTCT